MNFLKCDFFVEDWNVTYETIFDMAIYVAMYWNLVNWFDCDGNKSQCHIQIDKIWILQKKKKIIINCKSSFVWSFGCEFVLSNFIYFLRNFT